jgi:hypothetical protein
VRGRGPSLCIGPLGPLGLPLDLHCAVLATPSSDDACRLARLPSSLANASIGGALATRVVIPPGARETVGEEDLRRFLIEMRGVNAELLAAVEEKREAVREAYSIAGIELSRDVAGRLRKPSSCEP